MFKDILLESLDKKTLDESVVAPYEGQFVYSIGKEQGMHQVTFVNGKIVKVKGPLGKIKTFTRDEFANEFSKGGEVANESIEENEVEGLFALDIVSDDVDAADVAGMLRDVAGMLEDEEYKGILTDDEGNEIGSFCFRCKEEALKDEPVETDDEEVEEELDNEPDDEEGETEDDGKF